MRRLLQSRWLSGSSGAPRVVKSLGEAVSVIQPGSNVFLHTAAMTPTPLVQALVEQKDRFKGNQVKFFHMHTEGPAPYLDHPDSFHSTSFFTAANDREAVNSGRAAFIPVFLSEISSLWKRNILPLDACLLMVSPPDRHGWCSLGCSVDVSVSAMQHAKHVVAMVSPQVPRTHGDGIVHVSRLDTLVEVDFPVHELHAREGRATEVERQVGAHVASLIPDGATLQMGIGSIPDATLACLKDRRNLGIHSEMFSDGVLELIECGAISGSDKPSEPFQIVGSFALGTKKLYDFIDDSPYVKMMRSSYVNNPSVIRSMPRMCAINSCVQIDLTGQVCADSIGTRIYSGVGGQMDFIRGSSLSDGGKPIIAMTSRTPKGLSRVVPVLNEGAGVITTRNHVHHVVTEYGCVDLFGLNLQQRAEALIGIAHPDDRAQLTDYIRKRFPQTKHVF